MRREYECLERRLLMAADLSVSIGNGSDYYSLPGTESRYDVEITNSADRALGIAIRADVTIADDSWTWELEGTGDVRRTPKLSDQLRIAAGETIRYVMSGRIPPDQTRPIRARVVVSGSDTATVGAEDVDVHPDGTPSIGGQAMCFDETHVVGDTLYFIGVELGVFSNCEVSRSYASSGFFGGNLWKTDGTREGTSIVTRIRTERWDGENLMPEFYAPQFADLDGILYYTANDGVHQRELWRTDGTAEGTYLVKNVKPDGDGPCGHPAWGCGAFVFDNIGSEIDSLTAIDGKLYFTANDGTHGRELWVSDGTTAGTRLLKDIAAGSDHAFDRLATAGSGAMFTSFQDQVYFVADDGHFGTELWRTDGTEAGTAMVKDINPLGSAKISNLRVDDERLLFDVGGGWHQQTWTSDGTATGTVVWSDSVLAPVAPELDFAFDDNAIFLIQSNQQQRVRISEWNPLVQEGTPQKFRVLGETLIFVESPPWRDWGHYIYASLYAIDLSPYLSPTIDIQPVAMDWLSGGSDTTSDGDFGDLDGDGDLDLFTTVDGGGSEVWLNDGHGAFRDSGQRLGTGQHVYATLGDVDGDGDLDAVVAGKPNQAWLNDGSGNFVAGEQSLGTAGTDAALADLDGDGDLDLTIVSATGDGDWVWLNVGRGKFDRGIQLPPSRATKSVEVADVDGDGDLDLVTASNPGPSRTWINDGSGVFAVGQALDFSAEHIAVGDLDGDGDVDLVSAEFGPNQIWWNDGQGEFRGDGAELGGSVTSHLAVGDLDLDGDLDVVAANWRDEPSRVWLNVDGAFVDAGLSLDESARSEHVSLADIDGDGDLDVYFAIREMSNPLYRNAAIASTPPLAGDADADGAVGFADFLALAANFGKSDATWAEGDFDRDGRVAFTDFLVLSKHYGRTRWQ